jgi:pilus assembly protein CpaE
MSNALTQLDHSLQAVFSVCASPDISAAATEACDKLPSSTFAGEFHDYFSADRRPQFPPSMQAATGWVALIDCDGNPELALTTMEQLRTMSLRNLSIVALATQIDTAYLLSAMRAGCNEFLTKPTDPEALRGALIRFRSGHVAETLAPQSAGRIISFFGARGGVGTTTLAVHLANNLARRHRKRTLLIDHHHELGHVALYLGLKECQYHFDELVRNADRLDTDLLNGFVTKRSDGFDVLASPDSCAQDHKSSSEEMRLVLSFLRTQYDYVVIDSSMRYKEIVPPLLQLSDEIYIVSTPDVAALRDLARRVEHLSVTEASSSKLRIIINRSTSDDAITADQIEAIVTYPVWMAIPNHYAALVRAINAGEPIPLQDRSPFSNQINKWAEKVLSTTAAHAQQPGSPKKRFSFWPAKREKVA